MLLSQLLPRNTVAWLRARSADCSSFASEQRASTTRCRSSRIRPHDLVCRRQGSCAHRYQLHCFDASTSLTAATSSKRAHSKASFASTKSRSASRPCPNAPCAPNARGARRSPTSRRSFASLTRPRSSAFEAARRPTDGDGAALEGWISVQILERRAERLSAGPKPCGSSGAAYPSEQLVAVQRASHISGRSGPSPMARHNRGAITRLRKAGEFWEVEYLMAMARLIRLAFNTVLMRSRTRSWKRRSEHHAPPSLSLAESAGLIQLQIKIFPLRYGVKNPEVVKIIRRPFSSSSRCVDPHQLGGGACG